jgi:hypothetical protein
MDPITEKDIKLGIGMAVRDELKKNRRNIIQKLFTSGDTWYSAMKCDYQPLELM